MGPSRISSDLIFDLGLHKGEDTNYYLAKGFRVVAVEANPELANYCRDRFKEKLDAGSLKIIEGAIAPGILGQDVTFYVNNDNSVWGTVYAEVAKKKAGSRESRVKPITVKRVNLGNLFEEYGIPHYLKIDIEGADILAIESLRKLARLPQYISMEKLSDCLDPLSALGYKKFRIVPQGKFFGKNLKIKTLNGQTLEHLFENDCSGPYGDDLYLPWTSMEDCKIQAAKIKRLKQTWDMNAPKGSRFPGWYDTHASL